MRLHPHVPIHNVLNKRDQHGDLCKSNIPGLMRSCVHGGTYGRVRCDSRDRNQSPYCEPTFSKTTLVECTATIPITLPRSSNSLNEHKRLLFLHSNDRN